MESSTFQPVLDWLVQNPNLSGLVIFAIAAIESMVVIGVLVPGVAFLMGIGALVGLDALPLWSTLFWATAGAIFGDGTGYWLGRHYDKQLRNLWPLTRYPDLIPRGERFFKRHGGKSILFGRFVGPIRSVIPAIAGMMHMSPGYFYLVNIVSAIAWAPVVILPGVAFGASLNLATEVALRFAGLLVLLFFLLWFVAWLLRKWFGSLSVQIIRRVWLIVNSVYRRRPLVVLGGLATITISTILIIALSGAAIFGNGQVKEYSLTDEKWWGTDWQILPAYRVGSDEREPFTIQWHGELEAIKDRLLKNGWTEPDRLTMKNAMRWLTPTPVLVELPMWQKTFNQRESSLVMVKATPQQPGITVFRLWPLSQENGEGTGDPRRYWVGSLSTVDVVEVFAGFYIPQSYYQAGANLKKFITMLNGGESLPSVEYRTVQRKATVINSAVSSPVDILLIRRRKK